MLIRRLPLLLILLGSGADAYKEISDDTLKSLPTVGEDFDIKSGALLSPILIPRVPGTPGSTKVLNHFVDFFREKLPLWRLEFQNSTSKTPATGDDLIPFVNLIATRDPPWAETGDVGRLALVAHYDSKLEPEGFIGATDSAAPCAMLMHAARSIDAALTARWEKMKGKKADELEYKGVQIILLDGEEAFKVWSDEDSLYGARALAEEWEVTPHAAVSTYHNPLDSISLFLLLDLLGDTNPNIPSYFRTTHWAYRALGKLEHRFRSLGQFKSSPNHPSKLSARDPSNPEKEPQWLIEADNEDTITRAWMQDDHLPFMARGVEILHMIPMRFPSVWHTIDDDGEHLDMDTTEDWAMLVTAFAAEWMELEGFMGASGIEAAMKEKGKGGQARAVEDKEKRKAEAEGGGDKSELTYAYYTKSEI